MNPGVLVLGSVVDLLLANARNRIAPVGFQTETVGKRVNRERSLLAENRCTSVRQRRRTRLRSKAAMQPRLTLREDVGYANSIGKPLYCRQLDTSK
jgi:hypothetical protein